MSLLLSVQLNLLLPHPDCANGAQDVNLAAAYSESPSPGPSLKGSFTNLGAEPALGSRGNKENEGGGKRSSAGSENKYLEKQNQVLLGEADSCACLNFLLCFFSFLIFFMAIQACSCQGNCNARLSARACASKIVKR